jgi:hypothetical protein
MPEEPIYTPERKKQLESNIQKMIDNGLSKEDIQLYAKKFKEDFANKPMKQTQEVSAKAGFRFWDKIRATYSIIENGVRAIGVVWR